MCQEPSDGYFARIWQAYYFSQAAINGKEMGNPETGQEGVISDQKEILAELCSAKENGTLLGLWSTRSDAQMLMCQVESIYVDQKTNETAILFRERRLDGTSLQTQYLYLREIVKVHRFKKIDSDQS